MPPLRGLIFFFARAYVNVLHRASYHARHGFDHFQLLASRRSRVQKFLPVPIRRKHIQVHTVQYHCAVQAVKGLQLPRCHGRHGYNSVRYPISPFLPCCQSEQIGRLAESAKLIGHSASGISPVRHIHSRLDFAFESGLPEPVADNDGFLAYLAFIQQAAIQRLGHSQFRTVIARWRVIAGVYLKFRKYPLQMRREFLHAAQRSFLAFEL